MRAFFLIGMLCALSPSLFAGKWLDVLLEGNERYATDHLKHPHRSLERRESLVSQQQPFAIIVGCSDSRVIPETVFDQGLGDLFVIRVAGNVIGPLELDSIEYAALHLGPKVILVLGHENCGAVKAVVSGNTQEIEAIAELIEPSVEEVKKAKPKHLLDACIKSNAQHMKEFLLRTHVVRKLVDQGKMEVHAAYYNLETGKVQIL